ncbi:ankyrin-2-like [Aphis gossypii]|uniref:ankyrin-2-like n=1 Tax=Aphis gossypii TaxID=80765 RepID=UPI0021590CA5|nr:ankyrin-2-like [Aphis gossypii]
MEFCSSLSGQLFVDIEMFAQPIPSELTAKLLGNRVAVSPIVTVEPRRRKFHKPITLTLPLPQASSKGMINHYSGDAPTLRLLCSITGGTSRAQWEDVTGSTPLTFINDCVSFTTTVSARFWLMDCRNVADASKMATELYREAIHVPFMAKFVVFAKRTDTNEARIRLFCMTDDREDKTLEHKEHFTEVSNSRDVEVLEGKPVFVEFAGNLVPVTKSGEQLRLVVRAFKENRLPFTMRVKDPSAEPRSWTIIMKEPKVSKNEPAQTPVCVLQFGLPENIVHDTDDNVDEHYNYTYTHDSNTESHKRAELRITDISNFVSDDWINLAHELGFQSTDIAQIQREYPDSSGQQCMSMLNLWMNEISGQDSVIALERALNNIGRADVVEKCNFAEIGHYPSENGIYAKPEKHQSSQSLNNKYAAEEKAVIEDEIVKTVTERRMEIEQRLNGEPVVNDKKYESFAKGDDAVQMTSKSEEIPIVEPIEPTEVSFEHKRMSFERGVSIEQVLQEEIPIKDKSVMLEEKKMPSIEEKLVDVDVDVDATSLTFHEKRLSFEQGIPVKEIIQKKSEDNITVPGNGKESTVIIETEKSVAKSDMTLAEDANVSDTKAVPKPSIELTKDTDEKIRRDSILFEEVSQGLVKLDSNGSKVEDKSELLSPQSSRTPPPSPAEFKEMEQQNESKQRQTESISAEKEPQTALWSQDNDDLLDTHGFGEHLNGIETPNLSKPKTHKSLADIDEEFEERSVVLHPFFDQPKKDIFEQVQFIKHHDDSPAFDSPLTDKSVSHHDTGISLSREYSDTLTSSGIRTKPKHTDTAFDEEAELTDNGLSPIQPDEVGLAANEIIEIKKKIGMYDAGNSPIIFMESIALSPFETVKSDVSTITDNVKKIDVANSPIESNKIQRNMDTTVDVKKMIMQLEKSGAGLENVTFQQSPKRKQPVKTFLTETIHSEEHQTLYVDIKKEYNKNDTNTTNLQSKLDEVIKTEKCVLEHLEKGVNTPKNNSELENKLLQIVNIETNTGYKKEESIMEPIKVTGISKELKQLIDDEEKEQERMFRVLMNENDTNKNIYNNQTPVVEEIITPKRSIDLACMDVEKDDKDKNLDIADDEENEINNTKKDKSISFIPKTIEKGLKDITMTLTSIVKKMDVNDMSGKKNESEGGDRVAEIIIEIENDQLVTLTNNKIKETSNNILEIDKSKINTNNKTKNNEPNIDIDKTITNTEVKQILNENQKEVIQTFESNLNNVNKQVVTEQKSNENQSKNKTIDTQIKIENKTDTNTKTTTTTNEQYEKTETHTKTFIHKKNKEQTEIKTTNICNKTHIQEKIIKDEATNFENIKVNTGEKKIEKKIEQIKIREENPITPKYEHKIEENERKKEQSKTENSKTKPCIEGIESDKIHFDEFYKWVDKIVEGKNENATKSENNKTQKQNNSVTLTKNLNADISKTDTYDEVSKIINIESKTTETIDHEIVTDKTFFQKPILTKSDSNENVKAIISKKDFDDIVEHDKDLKITTSDKTKVDKTDSKDSVKLTTVEKTDTTDEVSKITTIESKFSEIIDHETVTDKTLSKNAVLTKPDSKESIKEIIGEKDLVDIVDLQKDKEMPTSDKTKLHKTDKTDEVSKTTTIVSKHSEIIDHKIITDIPLPETSNLTKSDSKESVKSIIIERDLDDIVEHDKDTKIPTSDKTELHKTDTTDEVSKTTTLESKHSEIIDHKIITDKPLPKTSILTKSDSKESVKSIISEKDFDDNVELDKDTKITTSDKTKLHKTDKTDEVSKTTTLESKHSEIIDYKIITDKPLPETSILTKSDSKESVKEIIGEKDLDDIVEHNKDTKIPTFDKTKVGKTDFKDSVTLTTVEKTDTTDEVSKTTTLESKHSEIIDHKIITEKPLPETSILTKSDSKESVKSIISERDFDDIVEHDKDTKITTSKKTKLHKTDTTDEVSKTTTLESKQSEIIDHKIITDKPLPETSILTKSDSKESVKEIIGEKDLGDIVEHDKDTKITISDKTKVDKTDFKDSVTLKNVEKLTPLMRNDNDSKIPTSDKTKLHKTDKTDEVSKTTTIESKHSEIIDHKIITDKPLPETSILTKSDSKEIVKSIISERDFDDIVEHDKDTKITTSDKTKIDKTDSKDSVTLTTVEKTNTTDDVSKTTTLESKHSEIIDYKIITDKALHETSILTKSDSKESVKSIISEKDFDDNVELDKDTKITTSDKTKLHKTDTTDEVSKITTIESKIITDKPLTETSILTKSDSKESVKSIISEKDFDDIVEHDKDTKITTSDKTKVDKTDSKDSVTLTMVEKTDTTDEVSKTTTLESKQSEIIDHKIITDKPLTETSILTKSDSKESVKSIISDKDFDDIVELDKDTIITTSDKTKVDKTDSKDSVTLTTVEKTDTTDDC